RLYLSDPGTAPRSTEPVVVQVLPFNAGVPDTATGVITGDTRVNGLFNNSSLRVSVTTSFRGPSIGPALAGSLTVSGLDATVIAERKKD
ncbi:MAG: hypothetical protein K8R56_10465, partial [Candidatus Eisenbacteria bacterium]|nr:hypothetical protein [Candidatus Eisenbacteria bacterium]